MTATRTRLRKQCPHCRQHNALTDTRRCRFCGVSFDDPIQRGRAYDRAVWIETHPAQHAWLLHNQSKSGFARSILEGLETFGKPTEKQQAALDRITLNTP